MSQTEELATLNDQGFAENEGFITVYNFHPSTGELTGTGQEWLSKGVGIPANSTVLPPPDKTEGMAVVMSDGKWSLIEDHRGETLYDVNTLEPSVVIELGPYPEGLTPLKPGTPYDKWNGTGWLTDAAALKIAQVNSASETKNALMDTAAQQVSLLQMAVDLDMATEDEKSSLVDWKKYSVLLNRIDTSSAPDITWPVKP